MPAPTEAPLVDRYVGIVRLARAGRSALALNQLEDLAQAYPGSVPVHRALALLALETNQAEHWTERFRTRLRRSPQDVGAAVGLAVLESSHRHFSDARRLLLESVAAGGRDPLLATLLTQQHGRPEELIGWFSARSSIHSGDARFAALRARLLLQLGQIPAARDVLESALARDPRQADLLTQHAAILRAMGRPQQACVEASMAAERLIGEQRVPEVRVPARLELVRAQVACGQFQEARRLLRTLGPQVSLPGDMVLQELVAVVEAELLLAIGSPVQALTLLHAKGSPGETDPVWGEAALVARVMAQTQLGLPVEDAEEITQRPLPKQLDLADRGLTLALLAGERKTPAGLPSALKRAAVQLDLWGCQPRAARLRALAGTFDPPSSWAPASAVQPEAAPLPEELILARMTETRRALAAGNFRRAADLATIERWRFNTVSPGLLATLGALGARGALEAGEPQRALNMVRDATLDLSLLETNRANITPELEPLALPAADLGAELAGLAFRAGIASGRSPKQLAPELLQRLGQVVRGWSLTGTPWPTNLEDLGRTIPPGGCLVVATTGPAAPTLAIDRQGNFGVAAVEDVSASPPCRTSRTIYWAGPAPPPRNLTGPGRSESPFVVHWVAPAPLATPAPEGTRPHPAQIIGPGLERPQRDVVEELAGQRVGFEESSAIRFDTSDSWPIFEGAGLAPSPTPLSAGWLVPPSVPAPDGWVGPETILALRPSPGAGLVALGMAVTPGKGEVERGSWVLAEAALSAGWRWVLLSRRPLTPEERQRVEVRLPQWAKDPVREGGRLAEEEPALAAVLEFWTAPPGTAVPNNRLLYLAGAMAVVVLWAAIMVIRARRRTDRQATTSSIRPGPA